MTTVHDIAPTQEMQNTLAQYEAMAALTEKMLEAASKSEWERFMLLEQRCAQYVQALKDGGAPAPLQGASRQKKVELIKKMLDDDRRIRDLTTPWMAKLSALISNTGTERRLAKSYGSV